MANVFLDKCTDLGSKDLTSLLWSKTVVGSHIYDYTSDPLLGLLFLIPDVAIARQRNELRTIGSNSRTIVKRSPSFLDGWRLFSQTLTNQTAPPPRGVGNWTPRISAAVGGTKLEGFTSFVEKLSDYLPTFTNEVGDKTFDDFDLLLCETPSFGVRMTTTAYWDFIQEIFDVSSVINFTADGTVDHHVAQIQLLGKTDKLVMYHCDCHGFWKVNHALYFGTVSYDVKLSLGYTTPRLQLEISAARDWRMLTNGSTVRNISTFNGVYRQTVDHLKDSVGTLADDLVNNHHWAILSCVPGLYHTQSKAYATLLGEVSKNFESLIESPGFISEVLPAAAELPGKFLGAAQGIKTPLSLDAAFLGKAAPPLGYLARLRTLLKLLAGGYLAYIFAIRPTVESAGDVLKSHLPLLTLFQARGGMKFKGTGADLAHEPPSLQAMIREITEFEIAAYDVLLTTTVYVNLRNQDVVDTVMALLQPTLQAGLLPEPAMIWKAAKFSFIVDMFLPVSLLIEHAQTFFSSVRFNRSRIGHSVAVKVTDVGGSIYEIYIRSDETDILIDPPKDSWLEASGPKLEITVPLALSLLL